jgi:GTP-binding protein
LITSLDYSSYVGRIAIGRIHRGDLREGMNVSLVKRDGSVKRTRIKELHTFTGLGRQKVEQMTSGDICAMVGIEGFDIGDTVCDYENPEPLDPIAVDEPTMSMMFMINNSPFYGKEGKYVTSRHLKDRLEKELEKNLALRVLPTDSADSYLVYGRGVLHLSVLIETMRREGYELQVGQPQVLFKDIAGEKCEPIEEMHVDVPEEYSGKVVEMVSSRKGEMRNMERKGDRIHLEFMVPSRGIIGLRTNMLTATAGEAVMNHRFIEYQPYKGPIEVRNNGSLVALETGAAFAYSIWKLQDRGSFFIDPGQEVYEGQVIGENSRADDLTINVCKSKKLTNVRASGSDEKARLITPIKFSLEEALEYIKSDELVEVTPQAIRMRKIYLKEHERKRTAKNS